MAAHFKATTLCAILGCLLALSVPQSAVALILPVNPTPVKVTTTNLRFTEGPLYLRNLGSLGSVLFTDLDMTHAQSRIYRYDITSGVTSVADNNSGGANGMYLNANSQVVTADRDRRQISLRNASDVSIVDTNLVSTYPLVGGSAFNGPNDLAIDSLGGIYFTDPDYENRQSLVDAAYYLSGDRSTLTRFYVSGLGPAGHRPNGIVLSPDGTKLYLAIYNDKVILKYDRNINDGSLSGQATFVGTTGPGQSGQPDGLTVDPAGNVYAALQNAVWAWNPAGTRIWTASFPEDPTNVEFGGPDGTTLYVTAGRNLYKVGLTGDDGDLDDDGSVDDHDIDILWQMVRGNLATDPSNNDVEDFDGSGFVNEDDVDYMLANLLDAGPGRSYGDADLDGGVGGLDYTAWRQRAGTGWANGDFDGDGGVGGLDYTLWRTRPTTYPSTVGAHGSGPQVVPEPASLVLLGLGLPALALVAKRRDRRV